MKNSNWLLIFLWLTSTSLVVNAQNQDQETRITRIENLYESMNTKIESTLEDYQRKHDAAVSELRSEVQTNNDNLNLLKWLGGIGVGSLFVVLYLGFINFKAHANKELEKARAEWDSKLKTETAEQEKKTRNLSAEIENMRTQAQEAITKEIKNITHESPRLVRSMIEEYEHKFSSLENLSFCVLSDSKVKEDEIRKLFKAFFGDMESKFTYIVTKEYKELPPQTDVAILNLFEDDDSKRLQVEYLDQYAGKNIGFVVYVKGDVRLDMKRGISNAANSKFTLPFRIQESARVVSLFKNLKSV